MHFALVLAAAGLAYLLAQRSSLASAVLLVVAAVTTIVWYFARPATTIFEAGSSDSVLLGSSSLAALFWSGLKAGSLTFGGAYTVIPFLQRDAVTHGAWMTNAQFMDGIALAGLLPAPLIIFSTFVGYIGGGPWGAVVMTIAIFLPAFALTLIAHEPLERLVHEPRVKTFLDGLTAGVVGLISATALTLLLANIRGVVAGVVFIVALVTLFYWNHRFSIPVIIAGAAAFGFLAMAAAR